MAAALGAGFLAGCDVPPPPNEALLNPLPAPKCEPRSEAIGRVKNGSADASPAASDEAARLRKLDYEAQCYRHAEMIARSRLSQLQEAVHDRERATKKSSDTAASAFAQ
ncbi:MAG: hypothetical protein J2P50_16500 [Hyphomicrobiaceae bacterium]|nr:hypothetical protein [Hyphomicrobiaceae bacterium]